MQVHSESYCVNYLTISPEAECGHYADDGWMMASVDQIGRGGLTVRHHCFNSGNVPKGWGGHYADDGWMMASVGQIGRGGLTVRHHCFNSGNVPKGWGWPLC